MKNFVARRPVHTVMATARYEQLTGRTPRSWQDAVAEYVRDHVAPRAQV
jgi:dTDP-4-dehydrorhamnose reductase